MRSTFRKAAVRRNLSASERARSEHEIGVSRCNERRLASREDVRPARDRAANEYSYAVAVAHGDVATRSAGAWSNRRDPGGGDNGARRRALARLRIWPQQLIIFLLHGMRQRGDRHGWLGKAIQQAGRPGQREPRPPKVGEPCRQPQRGRSRNEEAQALETIEQATDPTGA